LSDTYCTVSIDISDEEFVKLRDMTSQEAHDFLISKDIRVYADGYDHLKIICHRTDANGVVCPESRSPLFFTKKQKTLDEKIRHAEEQISLLVKDARIPEARQLISEINVGLSKKLDSWRKVLSPPIARVVQKENNEIGVIDEDDGYPD
jgi:hypothetical protein